MAITKNTESIEELKNRVSECEAKYRESFKLDSCSAIMKSYYDWQNTKKAYYIAIGVCRPTEQTISDNIDDVGDFNSLV